MLAPRTQLVRPAGDERVWLVRSNETDSALRDIESAR